MKRKIHLLSLVLFILAAYTTAGCEEGFSPVKDSVSDTRFESAPFTAKTTEGSLAVSSLDAQIASLEMLLGAQPQALNKRQALVDLFLMRTHFMGAYDDFDKALALTEEGIVLHPTSPDVFRLQSSALSAVHRFDEALLSLDEAQLMAGQPLDGERDTIFLAKGKELESLLIKREEKAASYPTFKNLTALAAVQSALGDFEAADASFVEALDAYNDVSPFPVAWVAFQRGVMWGESADEPEKARLLYEEAVRRLPQYNVANIHLAELEFEAGQTEKAVERLEALLSFSQDAEPMSRLAQFLLESDPSKASIYAQQAGARYEQLLAKHPYAFLDHAAEYYLGPGDNPNRALELTLENLSIRQNDRAYLLAIEAAIASNKSELACGLMIEAGPAPASIPLAALIGENLSGCL